MKRIVRFLFLLITIFVSYQLFAVDTFHVIIDTSKTFTTSTNIKEAKAMTISFARQCAIEAALPIDVTVAGLITNMQASNDITVETNTAKSVFAMTSIAGYIVSEKIVKIKFKMLNDETFLYEIILEAEVAKNIEKRNPEIKLNLSIETEILKSGDKINLFAQSSVEGFLYLFYFLSDNSVALLYPNIYVTDNLLLPGQEVNITKGYGIIASALPDRNITIETIYGILSTKRISGIDDFAKIETGKPVISTGEESYLKFQKWLGDIPTEYRDERAIQLHIYRN